MHIEAKHSPHYAMFAMSFKFLAFEEAQQQVDSIKLVVVQAIPSPWSEVVKELLRLKSIDFCAVHLQPRDPKMQQWAGSASAPSLLVPGDAARTQWKEILLYLETQGPTLLPSDLQERDESLELIGEILDPGGLCWSRRLVGIAAGLAGTGGYPLPIAKYLAAKYGPVEPQAVDRAHERCLSILERLTSLLREQRSKDSPYFSGSALSALDVYAATAMAVFSPLPEAQCPMNPTMRLAFESLDEATRKALDPALLEHRDFIYREHLELPVRL